MEGRIQGTDTQIELPYAPDNLGHIVRFGVRAGDILIATEPPHGLSARNVLGGRLEVLRREGTTVVALVDAGARLEVHVTPGAVSALDLSPGQDVWLIVKTHSFRRLEPSN